MLKAGERSKLDYAVRRRIEGKSDDLRALFAVAAVSDAEGQPLFTNDDIARLNSSDWRVLERIADEAGSFNEMGPDALEAAKKSEREPHRPVPLLPGGPVGHPEA